MIKRIGLLTSGGDCQALNATMRGVVKANTVCLHPRTFPESLHREELSLEHPDSRLSLCVYRMRKVWIR